MISFNKKFHENLKEKVIQQKKENQASIDNEWIDDIDDVNFWDFLSFNYLQLDRFFTCLDIENGANSGWEKFVESIGLEFWEDRQWCQLYHLGSGPTRAALSKLEFKKNFDHDLSLKAVLLLIKEMGRLDILHTINWLSLIENFKHKTTKKYSETCSYNSLVLNLNHASSSNNLKSSVQKSSLRNKKEKSKLPCILLTYASDAEEQAMKIRDQLKCKDQNHSRFNVVMLHDNSTRRPLLVDPNNILQKWFNQVRYIVPVLSPKYLRQIQNYDGLESDEALHNRFIYRLLLDQFVAFGSKNYRCRPVCPDIFQNQIASHSVIHGNGLFTIRWSDKVERIEDLATVLMDQPIKS